MKEIKFISHALQCSYEELPEFDKSLVDEAKSMTSKSYAPFSKFHVGAAIALENGEIIAGSNQENVAYPSGTCAERTTAFYAHSRFPGVAMKKIAIAAWSDDGKSNSHDEKYFLERPISPCGACRQVLLEYEKLYGPMEVILYGGKYCLVFPSVASLLPYCFSEFPGE